MKLVELTLVACAVAYVVGHLGVIAVTVTLELVRG
jgi:hypothetical protein